MVAPCDTPLVPKPPGDVKASGGIGSSAPHRPGSEPVAPGSGRSRSGAAAPEPVGADRQPAPDASHTSGAAVLEPAAEPAPRRTQPLPNVRLTLGSRQAARSPLGQTDSPGADRQLRPRQTDSPRADA